MIAFINKSQTCYLFQGKLNSIYLCVWLIREPTKSFVVFFFFWVEKESFVCSSSVQLLPFGVYEEDVQCSNLLAQQSNYKTKKKKIRNLVLHIKKIYLSFIILKMVICEAKKKKGLYVVYLFICV